MQCENCSVSMTYLQTGWETALPLLQCTAGELPQKCPNCASPYLRQFGVGTEQVQDFLQKQFPGAKISRMDADTTRTKGSPPRHSSGGLLLAKPIFSSGRRW